MPKDTTSPFSPGRPVPVEFFVGRRDEIERLRRKVRDATRARRIEVAFVSGERGIGKSSLVSFVRYLCEKELGVLGIHAFMGGESTVEGAVKRVFDQLLKENSEGKFFESIRGLFGKHVREVGLFGISVEFSADERNLTTLSNNFAPALRNLLEKSGDKKAGIVLILDDINGLAHSKQFADWFKSLVDEASTAQTPLPMCVVLVGLEERRLALIQGQPSLARVFDPVSIRAWNESESREFFVDTFGKVNVTCNDDALDMMTRYTGGLPVLAHEIGDAAFSADTDNVIDREDALSGVVAAADIVGRRYVDPVVYKSIRSSRYRTILGRIASELGHPRFTRSGVLDSLAADERKVFDNFLTKMKGLGVIVEDADGERGSYRFSNLLHYLYLKLEANQAGLRHR